MFPALCAPSQMLMGTHLPLPLLVQTEIARTTYIWRHISEMDKNTTVVSYMGVLLLLYLPFLVRAFFPLATVYVLLNDCIVRAGCLFVPFRWGCLSNRVVFHYHVERVGGSMVDECLELKRPTVNIKAKNDVTTFVWAR